MAHLQNLLSGLISIFLFNCAISLGKVGVKYWLLYIKGVFQKLCKILLSIQIILYRGTWIFAPPKYFPKHSNHFLSRDMDFWEERFLTGPIMVFGDRLLDALC